MLWSINQNTENRIPKRYAFKYNINMPTVSVDTDDPEMTEKLPYGFSPNVQNAA